MRRIPANLPEDGSRTEFLKFAMQLDELAYIRRAKSVEAAWEALLETFTIKRREMLALTNTRLAILAALVDQEWSQIEDQLEDAEGVRVLIDLFQSSQHVLRTAIWPSQSKRRIRRALRETLESMSRFNSRWQQFIREFDFGPINLQREAYNKYYPIEKACAFESEQIGFEGFETLLPVDCDMILEQFPTLRVPRLR